MRNAAHIVIFFLIAVWGSIELQFAKTFTIGVSAAIVLFVGLIGLAVSIVIWLVFQMHIPASFIRYFHF